MERNEAIIIDHGINMGAGDLQEEDDIIEEETIGDIEEGIIDETNIYEYKLKLCNRKLLKYGYFIIF